MITAIKSREDVRAFLQEALRGEGEEWLAEQVKKNLEGNIRRLPSDSQDEIYAFGIQIDPGVSYVLGNLNTESAWNERDIPFREPEMTSRYFPRNWKSFQDDFFLLGENNADKEEERLLEWCDEFSERHPAELNIDRLLGCWRIVIHGVHKFRESEFGKRFATVPFIATDFHWSEYCLICAELMNSDGQAASYFEEVQSGIAMCY